MMNEFLPTLLCAVGAAQLCIPIASLLVPFRLNWQEEFKPLSRLHRQLYWIYGGYIVLSIVALGLLTLVNARELAAGSSLARGFCAYAAIFWGVRLSLQPILAVKEHLTRWWLKLGYHALTVLFTCFTLVYIWAALWPMATLLSR